MHEVIIPSQPDAHGSRFGSCSCGIHKTKTVPCVHMIAATKSSKFPGLTSVNVTPAWCYTAVWREQFGEGTTMKAGFDIKYLQQNYQPNLKARYCPNVAAATKSGRPKNMKRIKSPLEGSKKKKRKTKGTTTKSKLTDDEMENKILGMTRASGELDEGKVGIL